MNVKVYGKVVACAFGAVIILSIAGSIIEASGIVSSPQSYRIAQIIAMTTGLILFLIIGFAMVPVLIRFFVLLQVKMGNSEHRTVEFLIQNEKYTVYGFWIFYAIGALIAIPAMIADFVSKM